MRTVPRLPDSPPVFKRKHRQVSTRHMQANEVPSPHHPFDKRSNLLGGTVGNSILPPAQMSLAEMKEMNHLLDFFARCKNRTPEIKRNLSASPGAPQLNIRLPAPSKYPRKSKSESQVESCLHCCENENDSRRENARRAQHGAAAATE
jgi:hypothetical protein